MYNVTLIQLPVPVLVELLLAFITSNKHFQRALKSFSPLNYNLYSFFTCKSLQLYDVHPPSCIYYNCYSGISGGHVLLMTS